MKLASWSRDYQGKVLLDRWSIVHFCFWLVIGANFEAMGVPMLWRWILIIAGALVWEGIELALEHYKPSAVVTHETAFNRWISDPLMGVVGGSAGMFLIAPLVH